MAVPYTFASATGSIPLSYLDSNFNTPITIGNTTVTLGSTITTMYNMTLGNVIITSVGSTFPNNYLANANVILGTTTVPLGNTATTLDGLTLANVTISTGNVTLTNITVTTANVTTANVGTAAITTANVTTANLTTAAIATANVTTANLTTAAIGTANVTTANVTTAAVVTLNATNANISANVRTQTLTGYLYVNANTGNVTAATTIPNSGLANSTATIGNTTVTLGSTSTSLGNLTTANVTVTNYIETLNAIGNSSTSKTIDLTTGTVQTCTLTGNCTFTMPTAVAGKSFILILSTGAGSFTATFTSVKWPSNTAPTITTTASRWDILTFVSDGTNWYGNFAQAYQ